MSDDDPKSWLANAVDGANRELRRDLRPLQLVARGFTVTLPISKQDATELRADLNGHFYAWTGQNIWDFKP